MGAKNMVIKGDYEGCTVAKSLLGPFINIGFFKTLEINKTTIEEYEILNEEKSKSATSAIGRAAVGSLLLGPIGLAAGLSAKSKGIYHIALQFNDGKKSLLEVDDKIYKSIIEAVF